MKSFGKTILFLFLGIHYGFAQDSAVLLSAKMFKVDQKIVLCQMDGWLFREGNDFSWANKDINTAGWRKLKPTELSAKYADKTGKVECWFRFKFKLDHDFDNMPLSFHRGSWAATELFLDGNLLASFGNTGTGGKTYEEYNPIDKLSVPVNLELEKEHLLSIHFVDYVSPFPPRQLKSEAIGGVRVETKGLRYLIMLTGPKYSLTIPNTSRETLLYRSIWVSVTSLLALLFWLLFFQNPNEKKTLLLIAVYSSFSAGSNVTRFFLANPDVSFVTYKINDLLYNLSFWIITVASFIIVLNILNFKISRNLRPFLIAFSFFGAFTIFFNFFWLLLTSTVIISFFIFIYILISSWKKLKGAQWAIVAGLSLTILFGATLAVLGLQKDYWRLLPLITCFYLSFPISLLVYVSLRFREIIREVQENARQVVQMTEEKKEQAVKQQKILEEEVARQTAELRTTLENLKSTQSQLVQSEKMASLGELTAGIAHEIQNPLNFVNNFSEVSTELLDEMKTELNKGDADEAKAIADDLKQNLEKILHHGKRADAIVKGMLQHSRTSSGQKELTDINALADEYLRLAYHGLRAKDKSFNATMKTDFDESIGNVNIIPQDIGRVILNLITNAFYAVSEKQKQNIVGYEPTVTVTTKKVANKVEVKVKDNGNGIPQKVLDKIFQPFFTTKPTGQGTGLGLSLSYDIVKAHGGELKVETKDGEGAEFIIQLPVN